MKYKLYLLSFILSMIYAPFSVNATTLKTAPKAMVVSAQHLATQVGVDVLKQGGNAVDAAVAMGYALAVVHPCCGNIGGGGFMLIHLANGKNIFINFREKAPLATKISLYLDAQGNIRKDALSAGYYSGLLDKPYLSVGVPGTVLGLNSALKEYGTLPLKRLLQPAITLASKGFVLSKGDVDLLAADTKAFTSQPNVAAIFLKNNQPFQPGQRLIQKDLAKSLIKIAQGGSQAFYQGDIAQAMIKASQAHHGIFTQQDFTSYTIQELKPLICQYRGYTIITAPPPSSGATICEMLNILDGYPLQKFGYKTAKSVHYNIEAMRYAFADRNTYLADPDFVKIPIKRLLAPEHAAEIRQQISATKAGNSLKMHLSPVVSENANTTSYVVWDKFGNAVSVIYTIDDFFGAKIIPGNTGFFLNNELSDFAIKTDAPNSKGLIQGKANLIAPGKRPLSSMSPTFVLKNNKLFMILGAPGGPTIPTQIVQTIENVIDYHKNIQEAVDAPHYHMQYLPDLVYMEPKAFSQQTLIKLIAMGYSFKLGSPFERLRWGAVTAIVQNPNSTELVGAIDSSWIAGLALGY